MTPGKPTPYPAMSPPLLTASLPGIGGKIKVEPEDFVVEEIPAYVPSGEGEHLYLWVEKRDLGPEFFARTIAQRLGTHAGAVGTAGLKDRRAVTRQWVSVPKDCEPNLKRLDGEGLQLLNVSRHTNKLKPGHSQGNRFTIRIRAVADYQDDDLQAILTRIREHGLPNYYGPQRFGRDGSTVELGFRCLAGTQPKRLRPFVYKFALSAVQSLLFNDYLGRRLTDGCLRQVFVGDALMKRPYGGIFNVEDQAAEQARFQAREIVTAGPMFGTRTFPVHGEAKRREEAVLAAHNLSTASFANFGKLMGGTRRHNLIYLEDLTAKWDGPSLILDFSLPSGCYATVLLGEIMKVDVDTEREPEDDDE
ncbi:MAG: tRNA pseudouridine(13) synthase TruD [Fimbriiglobus sp.]